ncbi:hypothetical protein [Pedobacter metabolipauper]|uniref:Tetratricopeptide repeat protein n=1 Tax=Pedobacter metabolipauper TaxID=425513 RepID=A0A4R6SZB5_9SPHI|nr:hypothetical protein [Pedobacter metabolipauper]TDQ11412.1 hypothetical protein ATK78_0534 [Pedobacter metabolipauper]
MKKILLSIFLLISSLQILNAQSKDIEDLYEDYTNALTDSEKKPQAIKLGLAILSRKSELSKERIVNLNYHLAHLYEESLDPQKAKLYYIEVLKMVPGHYISSRALGRIYSNECMDLGKQVGEAARLKDARLNAEKFKAYKIHVLNTLPLLEKAQACDPETELLTLITYFYNSIKDTTGLANLNDRLKVLSKDCVEFLD